MSRKSPARRPVLLPGLQLAATTALAATMLWVVFSETACWQQLWPTDIHSQILNWTGGSLRTDAAGRQHGQPAFVGLWLLLALPLLTTALLHRFRLTRSSLADLAHRCRTCLVFATVWLLLWLLAPLEPSGSLTSFLTASVSLATALLLALLLNAIPTPAATSDSAVSDPASQQTRHGLLLVLLAVCCWQTVSFQLNYRLYDNLFVPHGDSAMYEEHLWNTWHGKGFRSYLDQGLFLGEHIQVVHLLLLPLHMLWPNYLLLEWIASACLASCAIPIFLLARRWSGSTTAAVWLAIAWLLYFPMHYLDIAIDLKTLRPSCYGLPALFWGIETAERRRLKTAGLCFFIALLTQEDFALITGGIGVALWCLHYRSTDQPQHRQLARWGAGLAVASVAWVLLAVLVVIPAFRDGEVVHYSRYFGDLGNSPGDLVKTALTEPTKVAAILCSQRTLLYVLVLTLPAGLLPLRKPLLLGAGLATFTMLSLIQLGNDPAGSQQTVELPPIPYHHFHAPLLPVIFWAAAAGLQSRSRSTHTGRLQRISQTLALPQQPVERARLACLCAMLTAVSGSLLPCGAAFWSQQGAWGWNQLYQPNTRAALLQQVLEKIPATAKVASTDYVHTRLTHYERSYDYSDYVRAVNNYRPGVPADTDYIIIDTGHRYSTIRRPQDIRELQTEPELWELLPDETNGLFLVLKRRSSGNNTGSDQ